MRLGHIAPQTTLFRRCVSPLLPSHTLHQNNSISPWKHPPQMSKIPVTEVCLIHLKGPYNLKDPSTPEGAIWASSISTLKQCPGFRDIYTSSVVEDKTKARMFLSKRLSAFLLPPQPRLGVRESGRVKILKTTTKTVSTRKFCCPTLFLSGFDHKGPTILV